MAQEAVPVTKKFGTREGDGIPARVSSLTPRDDAPTALASVPRHDTAPRLLTATPRHAESSTEQPLMRASLRERVIEQIEPAVAATVSRDVLRRQIEGLIHTIADKER